MVNITYVDLALLATSYQYNYQIQDVANASTNHVSFISYSDTFANDILGPNPTQELVADPGWEAFHEAGVYNIKTGKIYATSNFQIGELDNLVNVTSIDIHNNNAIESIRYRNLREANGGAAFYPVGTPPDSSEGQKIVFCDEGDLTHPSQLVVVDPATGENTVILNNFFGRNFSSINDVEQHPYTGDLWFTDARYGYWQYFRPTPSIRPQVYRFEPQTGIVQAVADYFIAPNGLELSPDYLSVYVTDTGSHTFPDKDNLTDPATVYKFDITPDGKGLQNRRVFAYADTGFPDGIHTDTLGNVYTGVGNGVNVYNPEGILIGKFAVANGGVNNFVFVPGGIYIFNNELLFKVTIQAEGRTVKRDFGLY